VKRPSYLARLVDGAKGRSALRPPPVIFRPTTADTNGFVESVNESPVRGAAAKAGMHSAGAHRMTPIGPAPPTLRPARHNSAASAIPGAAAARETASSLSPGRVVAELLPSAPAANANAPTHASVSSALPPPDGSASRTPPSKFPPPELPEIHVNSRPREHLAAPATLTPRAPSDRARASSTSSGRKSSNSDGAMSVRIGTLEVRISPPPTPIPQKPAAVPRAPQQSRKESLARGFGAFGVTQG
jgi:hypothetical protein